MEKWKKYAIIFVSSCFFICFIAKYASQIQFIFERMDMLEKFNERGLKSPSRGILIEEYLNHMNLETIVTGYNFDGNHWFQHYGNNPHNSYIQLHHELGFVSIFIFIYFIYNLFLSIRLNKLIFVMMLALLLRGLTDIFLFYGLFSFLLFFLVFELKGLNMTLSDKHNRTLRA